MSKETASVTFNISEPKNGHTPPETTPKKPSQVNYIHIDLKGARPQLHFWINFCRLCRDWGDVQGKIRRNALSVFT